jgi:hypothetical protein
MYCSLDKSRPCPFPLRADQTYLGEDDRGYYVMDGFFDNIGNMFKRMVKFTPKSFTPSNIFKGVRNTMLTTMTGGVYLALPKSVKKTMEQVANVALPVAAAAIAAKTLGPSVMSMIVPKLSMVGSALGKNISTIGKGLFDMLGKLSPSQQSQVAQQVTPQDILYAEQHQGQFPPQFMQYVDDVAKSNYLPAVNVSLNPTATDTRQFYADSSLYPGLQQAMLDQQMGQSSQRVDQAGNWSSGEVMAAVGAGVVVAYLVGRK